MNSKTERNLFVFGERIWLVGIAVGLVCTVYFLIQKDTHSGLFFFGFFILAALQYLIRKRQRKKHEEYLKQKEEQKKNS